MAIQRRRFLSSAGAASLSLAFAGGVRSDQPRPNVVWITGEDFSPDLGCYGHPLVHSPNIDRLAEQGTLFTNAFTTAPVCSASRSAFMTGMYQTSIGAHHHRSHRDDGYRLPDGVHVITHYFRDAGYFTANVTNVGGGVKGTGKTDFNFHVDNPFDGNDWSQRDEGQPFFAHINFPETHRNFHRFNEKPTDPDKVELPPYYPDHPITREDWALYLDSAAHLDRKVGAVLKRLDDEGLAENTIVFFFGDHGQAHVRGKQFLYDSGIHIPLIVRWPGRLSAGEVNENLVSAIDFAPTSLDLAGLPVPDAMQGRVMLGDDARGRAYIVAARDRCDETMDRIRCVRDKRYKYIRNFMPDRPLMQLNRYKETQYPVLRLMRRLHEQGELTPAQARLMAESRPPEELYDIQADPHEIHNLAGDEAYTGVMQTMRRRLSDWIEDTGDLGQVPEDPAVAKEFEAQMKRNYDARIEKLYAAEGMASLPWE